MFTSSADLYDLVYSWKDYAAESAKVAELIHAKTKGEAKAILDVACGTGKHIELLKSTFVCMGIDLDPNLLEIARRRNPESSFQIADMTNFDLGVQFDAVICLFSAIGYVVNRTSLNNALKCFANHVRPGGVAIVEPWLTPDVFVDGHIHALNVNLPDIKISRMNVGKIAQGEENLITPLEFFYQIITKDGLERFEETHTLGLFTHEDYREAFANAGLASEFDEHGLMGRGLWIGTL